MSNIIITLDTLTFTAIALPSGTSASSYSLWTEDGSAWYFATDSGGTDSIKVTSDGTNGFPLAVSPKFLPSGTVGYAKGTAETNLVGISVR